MDGRAWDDYRRRRRLLLVAALGWFPGMFVLAAPMCRLLGNGEAFVAVMVSWAFFFIAASIRLSQFPCPRCGEPFFHTWYTNMHAKQCMHCDWPKWEEKPRPRAAPNHSSIPLSP